MGSFRRRGMKRRGRTLRFMRERTSDLNGAVRWGGVYVSWKAREKVISVKLGDNLLSTRATGEGRGP